MTYRNELRKAVSQQLSAMSAQARKSNMRVSEWVLGLRVVAKPNGRFATHADAPTDRSQRETAEQLMVERRWHQ